MQPVRQVLLVALVIAVLAGCGDTPAEPSGGSTEPAGSTGPAGTSPPASTGAGCAGSTPPTVTARIGERPGPVCLRRGDTVRIVTEASRLQPWTPLASSDESVLRCTSRPVADGAVEATCTAVGAGTATVVTGTGPLPGDPHGPPQDSWQLSVTVTEP